MANSFIIFPMLKDILYIVNVFLFPIGYNYVHTIPNGARDILIKQHGVVSGLDEDGNYLGALI